MTFFYTLNKKLDEIRATPETTHGQLNERNMSRAAKNGASEKEMDAIRKKYNKYDNEVDEGAYQGGPDKSQIPAVNRPGNRMTLQDLENERTQSPTSPEGLKRAQQRLGQDKSIDEGSVDNDKQVAQAALSAIGNTPEQGSVEVMIKKLQKDAGLPQTGKVPPQQPGTAGQPATGQPTMAGQKPMAEMDSSDAASDKREALAKRIYDLGMSIHTNDRMYASDSPQDNATLAKLKAEFARLHPGEDPVKIGSALSNRESQQRQQQRGAEFKQNQQAASRSTGIMQQAQKSMGGMYEEDLPMVKGPDGKMIPKFAADGKGKNDLKKSFAEKIVGAKEEVDEMLGDVAAEAMKNALRGQQQVADEGNDFINSRLTAIRAGKPTFKVGNKSYRVTGDTSDEKSMVEDDKEDLNPFTNWKKPRKDSPRVGSIERGHKHDIEHTATGRKVTRRVDDQGNSVGSETDAEGNQQEKRGRGRPKGAPKGPERVTAKATKHKGGRKTNEGSDYGQAQQIYSDLADIRAVAKQAQGGGAFPAGFASRLESTLWAAMTLIKNSTGNNAQVREEELDEKATSKKQQRFMGMVHAAQKGEKPASKEVGKVAKSMGKKDAKDFASTKHKELPEKAPKKEKTEETTVAGSMAPAAGGKSKGGSIVGKGIYDSLNRDLEAMINESMNVSVNMTMDDQGQPHKNITVSAEGEAAEQLAQLLNLAGMAQQSSGYEQTCSACGSSNCGCESELDENQPDWPTNTATTGEDDPLMRRWSGGVDGPKSTGQADGAPPSLQPQRQGVMGETKNLGMKLYAELKSFKG